MTMLRSGVSNHAGRISAERSTPDLLRWLVDIAHHQEQQISGAKRISLPCPFYGKPSRGMLKYYYRTAA
jgi:hypothetical protein